MAINDNLHVHPGTDCGCSACFASGPWAISPYSAWPLPPAMPPASPRCPATMRHVRPYSTQATGLQCKYTPGHDGDHAAHAGATEGDVFWPQEAPVTAEDAPAGTGM